MNCLNCNCQMLGPRRRYWYECPQCGFLASYLRPCIGTSRGGILIDETHRCNALGNLRYANFELILDALDRLRSPNQVKVLDVGCAHGWFLDAATRRGYDAVGIEPDLNIVVRARQDNHRVITGFFPADLPVDESFDIITFNDVFEHLADPRTAAAAAHSHLNENGILILNLPSSQGVLFRTARILDRIGISGPLDRMWQRNFPSPHLSYFNPSNLSEFFRTVGFREIYRATLPSMARSGLWQRLRYDRSSSLMASAGLWIGLCLARPIFQLLPSDILLQIFLRIDTAQAE
jgi:SAM-dependent methyltransferase